MRTANHKASSLKTTKQVAVFSLVLGAIAFAGAATPGKPGDNSTGQQTSTSIPAAAPLDPSKQARDESGARAILEQFLQPGADFAKLTHSLRPKRGHLHEFFSERIAERMYMMYQVDWNRGRVLIKPRQGQNGLTIKSATVSELRKQQGLNHFPSGYHWILPDLRGDHRIYVFTFTKPGETLGRTYDGLVHIEDQWVFLPKPWDALRRSRNLRLSPELRDPRNWNRETHKSRL